MPLTSSTNDDHDSGSSSDFDSLTEITVLDVYDLAADIGKEFEKMIAQHGSGMVQGLMPKVIGALELLEKTCGRQEVERQTVEDLRSRISLLEHEKREKALDRLRYERDIEHLEENWKKESQDLLASITRLQEENKKLSSALREKELQNNICKSPVNKREPDWDLFEKLREVNEKQREQLRARDKEFQDKLSESESLQNQVDQLMESNKELRRKSNHVAEQMRSLVEERADLQAALQEQSRSVDVLSKRLGLAQRDNQDLVQSQTEATNLMTNKLVIDLNDPNRPRFTIAELKDILCERNELKARVSELKDELSLYRPDKHHHSRHPASEHNPSYHDPEATELVPIPSSSIHHSLERDEPDDGATGDLPVQGPLPYEPDDAPWKRSTGPPRKRDLGIRRLYDLLF